MKQVIDRCVDEVVVKEPKEEVSDYSYVSEGFDKRIVWNGMDRAM